MNYQESIETFNFVLEVPKKINEGIIRNLIKLENYWILDSAFEFILKFSTAANYDFKKGINKINIERRRLEGVI
jgi:hypothetical protein